MNIVIDGPSTKKSAVTGKPFQKELSCSFDGLTDDWVEATVTQIFGQSAMISLMTIFYRWRDENREAKRDMEAIQKKEGQEWRYWRPDNATEYKRLEHSQYKSDTIEIDGGTFNIRSSDYLRTC